MRLEETSAAKFVSGKCTRRRVEGFNFEADLPRSSRVRHVRPRFMRSKGDHTGLRTS